MQINIMTQNKKYGWRHDLPDQRDFRMIIKPAVLAVLPPKIDLRITCPPVVDQLTLGSCTANAIANAHRFDQIKQKNKTNFPPSRLFIYYNERVIENTVKSDSGAEIRDGIKSINNQGVCTETTWPYTISKFKTKPTAKSFTEGLLHKSILYQSLTQTLDQLKGCLASGFPFVFGFTVYESFESDSVAKTGIIPMPKKDESVVGGHAVLCCGYDDTKKSFIVMNSWGTSWGDMGFFYMPYTYLTTSSLSSDFWVIQSIKITSVR